MSGDVHDAAPRAAGRSAAPPWDQEWVDAFLLCPACRGSALRREADGVRCSDCGHALVLRDERVLSDLPAEPEPAGDGQVATRVRRFYEEHPFPNYDGFESVGDLLARASRSQYAAMLDRQIPIGARVLEVGCGTGQLGLFLSIGGRAVVGADMTRASLQLGSDFARRHGLSDAQFLHGSLFDLPLRPESFDLLICKGVLHHTPDARGGLARILPLLRPGGYVICGLYNAIGRSPTSLRRLWFRLTGNTLDTLDPVLRDLARSDEKKLSWFLDQYAHPHETRHSVDELLEWFAENDVEPLQCVPPLGLTERLDPDRSLFEARPRGTLAGRLLTQVKWIFTIGREGALFDMIGRKRGGPR